MASNPVLTKLEAPTAASGASGASSQPISTTSGLPPAGTSGSRPVSFEPAPGSGNRYMTLDDVVVRTAAMLAVIILSGSLSWALATSAAAGALILVGVIGGLALGLYIAFTTKANALTALTYAAFEGLFLGAISRIFESAHPGIVGQAIVGTVMVAAGMLFVYRIGAIRVTPRFWRVVAGATIGVVGLMFVDLLASFFHDGGLGLRQGGLLGIGFSLICIVVASLNLVLDFDLVERSIRRGTDEKFAWYCAFGIMVTLIWLYLEILRLLGNLRN
ncbi:Uncharacterized membrane protein, YccA/Bax inhibitor family [Frankineae bacterium MT45]|nr:Uncharacterized membrane protein, YccA/Bax inhibitor family [Frankineae bacterium MT45]